MICKILGVFRNTLTANEKYLFRGSKNFLSPIPIQVSLKPKALSEFFVPFLESTSNFKHFEKKDDREERSSQLLLTI